jgi:hypothetical protein
MVCKLNFVSHEITNFKVMVMVPKFNTLIFDITQNLAQILEVRLKDSIMAFILPTIA